MAGLRSGFSAWLITTKHAGSNPAPATKPYKPPLHQQRKPTSITGSAFCFKAVFGRFDGVSFSGGVIYQPAKETLANRIFVENNFFRGLGKKFFRF